MKRVIVDFKKLNQSILELLVAKFPDGYGDEHVITFKNQHNETIEAVEVHTEDTIYLVKISKRLADTMEAFDDDSDDDMGADVDNTPMDDMEDMDD
ncbi:hypothetical protein ACJRPK_10010 [Aquimarina sp. 2-A2]|uniref:hypothetical protein n=1 Tax=Aquimarina sp. 2-A2 TaxID=3382644 RepID=UPI00387F1F7E